ncbi:DSD1 family PLP-dependent enzyme [Allopusillimonas ginsengisoli]|nr:DSD1 family PLP-dependent enzyme [Allopusillimonas ginsengisoli]
MKRTRPETTENPTPEGIIIPPAATVGRAMADIDTPSLILDLDTFEENLRAMQALAERHGIKLRPHAKAHRCPAISHRQVALGAQGICCQKVSEAVPFVTAGLRDILISNEVVGAPKLALLAQLALQARMSVCVDNPQAVRDLSAAMASRSATVRVLVEVDVGQKRCGVQTTAEAVALAQLVAELPGLEFAGIQAYHGGLQHKRAFEQRRQACEKAARLVQKFVTALEQAGLPCAVVTGGGTGSAVFDIAAGVYTEIQPGSYAFMDADYGALDWGEDLKFRHSLFVLASVISTPTPERVVVDAGLKSLTAESGVPLIPDHQGLRCLAVNDEHSIIVADTGSLPGLGEKLRLIPGHCDPTFNLHDQVVAMRGGQVEAIWPISARGLST